MALHSGSWPSSSKAARTSLISSAAIELLPLRCITTRTTPPSRTTSTNSPMAPALRGEERDPARHLDRGAGDVASLLAAEERDRARDVGRLAEALEDGPVLERLVHRVGPRRGATGLREDDPRHHRVGGDAVAASLQRRGPGQAEDAGLGGRVAGLAEAAEGAGDR